jgi:hypothetical protein
MLTDRLLPISSGERTLLHQTRVEAKITISLADGSDRSEDASVNRGITEILQWAMQGKDSFLGDTSSLSG